MQSRVVTWPPWARLINPIYSSFIHPWAMQEQTFITRPMSLMLDAVRALAALVVLVGHAVQIGIYGGYFPFSIDMQHNAVIVFFVLSGLVIARAVQQRHTTLFDYALARAVRIVPTAVLAVAFSAVAAMYGQVIGMAYPWPGAEFANVLLPLVFLSESIIGSSLVWNPPFWSLCYEVWFYAIFGATMFLKGRVRILSVLLLTSGAGFKVLLLMPVWLTGVALAGTTYSKPMSIGAGAFAISAALFVGFCVSANSELMAHVFAGLLGVDTLDLGFSQTALTDLILGLCVASVFLGLSPFASCSASLLEKTRGPIAWLAGCSFTIYVIHWPLLLVLRGHGLVAGESVLGFAAILAGVVAFCGALASVTERRSTELRAWLIAKRAQRGLSPVLS